MVPSRSAAPARRAIDKAPPGGGTMRPGTIVIVSQESA